MSNLYFLNETYTNGFMPTALDVFAVFSTICSILVIVSKNPVVSILFLIGLFLSISCYLITIGLNFIGLSYLLVYVGAVSILFLFILMLINVRISELLSNTSNGIPLSIIVLVAFYFPIYNILPYSILSYNNYLLEFCDKIIINHKFSFILYKAFNLDVKEINNSQLYFVTSKVWDGYLAESTSITAIGNIMYTSYSIWLIITSIILLLAMVGAIIITIKKTNITKGINSIGRVASLHVVS